jgi:predicted phosphoribosyltransferase
VAQPEPFHATGVHYRDFSQVEDAEVLAALDAAAMPAP